MSPSPASAPSRTAAELRRAFLDFFSERGHTVVPSSPLVPIGDPTMLFTTAGMVQFKPYYSATGDVPYTRAVSVQKCLRLTDLENVGTTPRHGTFFEMLGNFSFGPREKGAYFKAEAIAWGWEFVTQVLGLPRERLYASVFEGEGKLPRDDEAAALWKKVGLPEARIVYLGRKDNFWGPAGGQGACGPCSEIYFDLGERRPDYLPDGAFWGEAPGDEGDRYMEFWNLVFPQFDAQADGSLVPLRQPGIDTGMGIERLALLMQGKSTIFETDLYAPLVDAVLELSSRRGGAATRDARIVADHVRGLTFALAEGALPGNEGAGYVLRRLLRRAVTRLRSRDGLAVAAHPVLGKIAERAIGLSGGHYRELVERRGQVMRVLEQEEAAFVQNYEAGLARLEGLLHRGARTIAGEDAFALHDTYGFPVELTEEIAHERGVSLDRAGFERAMEAQRTRARAASKFKKGEGETRGSWTIVTEGPDSAFVGYEALEASALSIRRWREADDGTIEFVLDRTPCYAESGGQVADRGQLEAGGVVAELEHVYKEDERTVHRVKIPSSAREAFLATGSSGRLAARVSHEHRFPTMRHHTATHLLHAELRDVLGTHVHQAGSLVAPDRLRFDYTHFEAPNREQLARIERQVVEWILRNRPVSWAIMPIDEAKALGAMALFGEKYGAEVRVVTVPGVEDVAIPTSRELCGGTHVSRTGDIGAFVIVGDSAIASGVRRIEALCGHEALRHAHAQTELLARTAAVLRTSPASLPEQVEKLRNENERLKKAQTEAQRGELELDLSGDKVKKHGKWSFFVERIEKPSDPKLMRELADSVRLRLGHGAALWAFPTMGGSWSVIATATADAISETGINSGDIVRSVAGLTGGSGGGQPKLALGGVGDVNKLGDALVFGEKEILRFFTEKKGKEGPEG